jgi:hypothetical protein
MSSQRYQSDSFCFKRTAFYLSLTSEQSRTRSHQSGGVEDQPQCRGLWHICGSPSERSFSRSPSPPPPSFTQSPSSPRSLVRDGKTSPLRPRFVVSRSTCPPYPSSPGPRQQLCTRYDARSKLLPTDDGSCDHSSGCKSRAATWPQHVQ